jgi:hypothetical protein
LNVKKTNTKKADIKKSLYHSTLAALTQIILFSGMLRFSRLLLEEKNVVKENIESSKKFYLLNGTLKIN